MNDAPAPRLTTWALLCYAAPGIPASMALYAVGVIVPGFYAEYVGLTPAAIGEVLLFTRLIDVGFDLGVGYLSDATRSRYGARKPWVAAAAPVLAAAFVVLLAPPKGAAAGFLFLGLVGFYAGWSALNIPYDSWGSELAADYAGRARLFGYRAGASYVGSLLFSAIPTLPIFTGSEFSPSVMRFSAVLVAGLLAVSVPLAILFMEREPDHERERPDLDGVFVALRYNRPLQIYTAAALVNGLSNGMFVALVFLYQSVYMGFADRMWLILIVYVGASLLALPPWALVVRRFGKHRAWAVGLGISALCYPPMALLPPGEASFLPILALAGLAGASYSISNVATPAVLGDVVDFETLRSGTAKAGILFALQALIAKFNVAVGTGLAFLLIGAFGFTASGTQTPWAVFGIQLAHLYLPSALNVVGLLLIWRFPLDQRRQTLIRARLDERAVRRLRARTARLSSPAA